MYRSSNEYRSADRKISALKATLNSEMPKTNVGAPPRPPSSKKMATSKKTNLDPAPVKTRQQKNEERDEQIAELFTAMRRVSRLSTDNLATRLQTTPEMINALEHGNLSFLPEWDDTARVVIAYANFVNIDERPILRRLRERLTEHFLSELTNEPQVDPGEIPSNELNLKALSQGRTQSLPPIPKSEIRTLRMDADGQIDESEAGDALKYSLDNFVSAPPQVNTMAKKSLNKQRSVADASPPEGMLLGDTADNAPRTKRFGKVAVSVIFSLVFVAVFMSWQPNRFWSGVDQLPKPVANSIYSMFTAILPDPLTSLYKMQWIKVENPRLRKADKLPVPPARKLPPLNLPSK